MDIDNAFTDPEIEREGIWVDYRDGSKVKVARIGNPNFTRIYDAKLKPHRRKQRAGSMETELETRILCEVVAKTVLLDWKGFTQGKGEDKKEYKYTEKRAFDMLSKSIDFRNEIVDLAAAEETFHQDDQKDSEKN